MSTVSGDMCECVANSDIFTKVVPFDVKTTVVMLGGAGEGPGTEMSL